MATVPGPPVRLYDVYTVFGGYGEPLHNFGRGGPHVPNIPQNANVPLQGNPIRLAQLAGATNYVPISVSGPGSVSFNGYNHRPPVQFQALAGTSMSGGNGSPNFQWTRISGDAGITVSNANILNPYFQAYGGLYPGEDTVEYHATWQLHVWDGISEAYYNTNVNFFSI